MTITINTAPGQRYIELGCGDNPHPACQVHVDVRPGKHIDFQANLEEPLPIKDADFDGCLAQYVLEHLNWRKVRGFLKEVHRILKPTGRVLFVTANTAAQFDWIKKNPDGWDGKDDFDSFSCILFGDQDYPDNAHKNYLDPQIITKLMIEAGFKDVIVHPVGARNTDMAIEATKADPQYFVHKNLTKSEPSKEAEAPKPVSKPVNVHDRFSRPELFDKHYFNGGCKVGGYAVDKFGSTYRDFAVHELITKEVLKRHPKSVLEVGCARGFIVKRLQDSGIRANGLDISNHCWLTRACDGIICRDVIETPWPFKDQEFDLSFSCAFLEHVPEEHLPAVLGELKRVCSRHLHAIDFGDTDDGFDKTHVSLLNRSAWVDHFTRAGIGDAEIVSKHEMEKGTFPEDVLRGDGLRLNLGSHVCMHYGWQNIDINDLSAFAAHQHYNFLRLDIRNGIPHATAAVDSILMSHVLEHFTYDDGLKVLKECRRILKPSGNLRVIVPDAGKLLSMYGRGEDLSYYNEVSDGCEKAATQAGKLHALLYDGHLAIYDQDTLADSIKRADLIPQPSKFRGSRCSATNRQTIDMFPEHSLYFDAYYEA